MTAKRDTGRQRRANQNRAAREALVARRQAAAQKAEPAPEPVAKRGWGRSRAQAAPEGEPVAERSPERTRAQAAPEAEPAAERSPGRTRAQAAPVAPPKTKSSEPRSASASAAATSGRSRFTPAPVPEDAPPAAGIRARAAQLPGGQQMLAGFVLVAAGSLALCFLKVVRVEVSKGKFHTETFLQRFGPIALVYLALPVLLAAIPLLFMNHRRRRTAWNIGAFAVGLWILLSGLGLFYLFGAGAMVWGVMKASRAEGPAGGGLSRFGRRSRRPEPATTDDPSAALDVDGAEVEPDQTTE